MNSTFILSCVILFLGFFITLAVFAPSLLSQFFDSFLDQRQQIYDNSVKTKLFNLTNDIESCWDDNDIKNLLDNNKAINNYRLVDIDKNYILTKQHNNELIYCLTLNGSILLENNNSKLIVPQGQSVIHNLSPSIITNMNQEPSQVLIINFPRNYSKLSERILSYLVNFSRRKVSNESFSHGQFLSQTTL